MKRLHMKNHRAFTYIELIVAVSIFLFVSLGFRFIVTFLSTSVESESNIIRAKSLLQNSLEEIRGVAQIHFDDIIDCQFPQEDSLSDVCEFQPLGSSYKGFMRSLTVSKTKNSDDLKKITVNVKWSALGRKKQLQRSILLARPKHISPGLVTGSIKDKQTGNLIDNALVLIRSWRDDGSDELIQTVSLKKLNDSGNNFEFSDRKTGAPLVPVGKWCLEVKHAEYKDFSCEEPLFLLSSDEKNISISLEKKETKGYLEVRFIDSETKKQIEMPSVKDGGLEIQVYEGNRLVAKEIDQSRLVYYVNFEREKKRCFTVKTKGAYRSGYAGKNPCLGDPHTFDPDGISSELINQKGQWDCSLKNNEISENKICVTPSAFVQRDFPLSAIPERVMTGRVIDTDLKAIANAKVHAFVYDREWIKSTITDRKGFFRLAIADNRLLWAISGKWRKNSYLWAEANLEVLGGCYQKINERRYSDHVSMPKTLEAEDDLYIGDLMVQSDETHFGGLRGDVIDARFGFAIDQIKVAIEENISITENGKFAFECKEQGFVLPEGNYHYSIFL